MRSKAVISQKLILILTLYLILATAYSIIVPIGRGADEWAHYWYAEFIADNGRLPRSVAERETAGYKSDWPPLYHFFAAGLTGWIDTEGPPTFKYRAESLRRHLVPAQGPEAILHTEDERFPWQQEILVWHLGRFLSIAFSTATLIVTYFIALEVFSGSGGTSRVLSSASISKGGGTGRVLSSASVSKGGGVERQRRKGAETEGPQPPNPSTSLRTSLPISQSPNPQSPNPQSPPPHSQSSTFQPSNLPTTTLPLLTVAVLAFNPRFLFTGMLFNYDSLTLLLSSLFLWLSIRVVKSYQNRWHFWGLGALAGLALVTKYLTAPLVIVVVGLALYRSRETQRREDAEARGSEGRGSIPYVLRFTFYILRHATKHLTQAALAFLLLTGWWFAYLILTFNEIDTYGPVLGTLAPLIRGDGSDRTVEALFAWLSGGQAPAPAHIDKQSYTAWQIITELPITFWGNPIIRPYPLTWFIVAMSIITILAAIGLIFAWQTKSPISQSPNRPTSPRPILLFLILYCLLPTPFMLIRLFGARDAFEAVQGRHILFLAGPAVAVLLVWGWSVVSGQLLVVSGQWSGGGRWSIVNGQKPGGLTFYVLRFTFYALLALLLSGAVSQLLLMKNTYPPLLPVQTTPLVEVVETSPDVTLDGGATLVQHTVEEVADALKVTFLWRGGEAFAPEDYQLELALVDEAGQTWSSWRAYQTQARYPTRAWEPGDIIRDEGWLPLAGVPVGEYDIRWRLLGQFDEILPWQILTIYDLTEPTPPPKTDLASWLNGQPVTHPPLFKERETAQFTIHNSQFTIHNFQISSPDNQPHSPLTTGPTWANFIIAPDWPPGDYIIVGQEDRGPLLRVADNGRTFTLPEIWQPTDVNFEDKIKLLGYNLPSRRVEAGDGLPLTLHWQGLQWLGEEFVIFTRLVDNQGLAWGGYDRLAKENYSTLLWAPGEIISDGFAVPVEADAPDGVYYLNVGWYRQVEGQAESLPILDPATGQPTAETAVTIGPVKVGGPPAGVTVQEAAPQWPVEVTLGDKVELLGIDIKQRDYWDTDELSSTATLDLTFYWQTVEMMDIDYTIFVHIRDMSGETVAQKDSPPANGAYPTNLWDTGEIIEDRVSVLLDELAPGQYEVVVGMYDFLTGQRLSVDGSSDDTIMLPSIRVGGE